MGVISVRLQAGIENPLEQRWSETIEALDSVKSGKSIDEKTVNDGLDSRGSESELEPYENMKISYSHKSINGFILPFFHCGIINNRNDYQSQ